ncbi:MAG: hypothetical protein QM639_10255 [Rhodocyclaceae bacterium]
MAWGLTRRFAAALLAMLHLGAAIAQTCSNTSTTTTTNGLGAVFSVFDGGTINLNADNLCRLQFLGGGTFNVSKSGLQNIGTNNGGTGCKDENSKIVTASDKTIARRTLDTFPDFTGSANPIKDNDSTVTVPKGDYASVNVNNSKKATFVAGTRIKGELTVDGSQGSATFEPGTYYIGSLVVRNGAKILVSGSSGTVTLNIRDTLSLNAGTCVNIVGSDCPDNLQTWVNNSNTAKIKTWAASQTPERLQLNVYQGNYEAQARTYLSAGVYIDKGKAVLNGQPYVFVGEILAASIESQNNPAYFISKASAMSTTTTTTTSSNNGYYALAPAAVPARANVGDYAFLATQRDVTTDNKAGTSGHLQAYALAADGSLASEPAWDAASIMTAADRRSLLQTVSSTGSVISLATVDADAFGAASSKSNTLVETIINPNYNNGAMLAGRAADSLVGRPWRTAPIIVGTAVLFAADDGILYSVDRQTGALKWGWMPRQVLPKTADPKTMADAHPWGQITSVTSGNATYITGSILQGAVHVSLKLKADGTIDSVAWMDDRTASGATSPSAEYGSYGGAAPTPPVRQTSTVTKVAYVVSNKLVIRNVDSSGATAVDGVTLSKTVTSNLLYLDDSAIYFGDSNGDMQVTNSSGTLGASPGSMGASTVKPIISVNGAYLSGSAGAYLVLLGHTTARVAAFKWSAGAWTRAWYVGPQESSGVSIEQLPANATITAMPTITDGKVFIPVTVVESSCVVTGYAYGPISLDSGVPTLSGVTFRGTSVGSTVLQRLGSGESLRISVGMVGSRSFVFGHANNGASGASAAAGWGQFEYTQSSPPRRVNWRELTNYY